MRTNVVLFAVLASFILLAAPTACAQRAKVLFYESSKVSKDYKIGSGYSSLKTALEAKGYSVQRYEGTLTRADLDNYDPDVLVIAGLTKSLDADELAAVFEFVMQKGRGLFICGGTSAANQITIPFGMTVDDAGTLEDETSKVVVSSASGAKTSSAPSASAKLDKTTFVISNVEHQDSSIRLLVEGVNTLAFFGGNGISVSGDAKVVARGDEDTYSPKSSTFPKSSRPPVATAVLVGNGMVVLLSDPDMLLNDRVDAKKYKYDNLRFGTNIIEWLRSSTLRPPKEYDVGMLGIILDQRLAEITAINESIKDMNLQLKEKGKKISDLNADKAKLLTDTATLKDAKLMGIGHWELALCMLAVSVVAVFLVTSKGRKKDKKQDAGLGYEFDEAAGTADPTDAFSAKVESFDEAMGMEKK